MAFVFPETTGLVMPNGMTQQRVGETREHRNRDFRGASLRAAQSARLLEPVLGRLDLYESIPVFWQCWNIPF